MGIVIFLSLKSLFSLVLDAIHTEATLNKMTFRKVTSDLNPRLLFFSLDEESIGLHLLGKLMWFGAIRRHSHQIKLLLVSWTARPLLGLGAFAHASFSGECLLWPTLLTSTWLTHTHLSGLIYSENFSVTPLIPPRLVCLCSMLTHI